MFIEHDFDLDAARRSAIAEASVEELIGELVRRGRWTLGDRDVLNEVRGERYRQDARFGVQDHPDVPQMALRPLRLQLGMLPSADLKELIDRLKATGGLYWLALLLEEVAEAGEAAWDPVELRRELVQVAAVAVAWIEAIDRRGGGR
jgi:hypothetical protein